VKKRRVDELVAAETQHGDATAIAALKQQLEKLARERAAEKRRLDEQFAAEKRHSDAAAAAMKQQLADLAAEKHRADTAMTALKQQLEELSRDRAGEKKPLNDQLAADKERGGAAMATSKQPFDDQLAAETKQTVAGKQHLTRKLAAEQVRVASLEAGVATAKKSAAAMALPPPAKVYTGDVRIATEADVSRFAPLLRGVTKIDGNVDTMGAPITEAQLLDLFGHVQEVTGYLDVDSNANLTSVDGLRSVTTVCGYLAVRNCANLTTLEGLRGVTSVGGDLFIHSNPSLTTLEGLRNLEVIRNTEGASTSLDLINNPLVARGLPFPKLRVNNGDVYLGNEPNAYVASHRAALERVPRA
jgi:hypothetical protein